MLPPGLKKFLQSLGINTVRLEWKLRYWRENARWSRTPFARWFKTLSYEHKYCKCGALVDKNATVCPHCGEAVLSRAAYRIGRALGFVTPEFGFVWIGLMVAIAALYLVELRLDGLAALGRPKNETLVRLGALFSPLVAQGELWRLLSAGLIHGGLIHIGFNVMAISQLAPVLEDEAGPWPFVVLITVTQLGCALASLFYHILVRGFTFSLGASGIAFGLIGFGLAHAQRTHGKSHPLRDVYLKWALYGLVIGFLIPGIDNAGHVGGLAAGGAFAFAVPVDEKTKAKIAPIWKPMAFVCMLLWGYALFSMARHIVATGGA